MSAPKRLLIVHHTQSGNTGRLAAAVLEGALRVSETETRLLRAFDAGTADLLACDGLLLGTPENFGYMSGALKDFFDRTYYPCEGKLVGLPYAVFVSAGNDGTGAVREIGRIANGYGWKMVAEALIVRREITPADLERARELGEAVGESGWDMLAMLKRLRHQVPNAVARPGIKRLVHTARDKGLRVGILSNELELFWGADFLARMDIVQDMHVVVDATHTNILKPDPRAYALACEGLGVAAERILFIDDQFRNIAGAHRAGLQTQFFDLRDVDGCIAAAAARLALPLEGFACRT